MFQIPRRPRLSFFAFLLALFQTAVQGQVQTPTVPPGENTIAAMLTARDWAFLWGPPDRTRPGDNAGKALVSFTRRDTKIFANIRGYCEVEVQVTASGFSHRTCRGVNLTFVFDAGDSELPFKQPVLSEGGTLRHWYRPN